MLIAAIGDAHLGRSYLPVTTPEGLNQRERDFEVSFEAAVELALAQRPELVIWLGDIFDHPRPTYHTFRIVQRALARIRDHGVPAVLISGNHDTPRLAGTGSPYSPLADAFGGFHFAHRMSYERIELPGLVIHAVPQMMTVEATLEALARADRERSVDRVNLLLTHPRLPQVQPKHSDINEIEVDAGELLADLVLLGHYHVHTTVRPGMWYAGSTDSFTYADEPEAAKGIVTLDTDSGVCRHLALEGQRPLLTLESVAAIGMGPAELSEAVLSRVAGVPAGAVARLYLEGVDPEAYKLLDMDTVREAHREALHVRLIPEMLGVGEQVELPALDSLPSRWARYVSGQDLTGFDRERVDKLGRDYLDRAVEHSG
ncbi:MAG: metallophosphoesterase family protein [Acidimicrobiales bacterium]